MTTAAIELATATSAIAALANVEADFGGGLVVSGVFDNVPGLSYDQVQIMIPQLTCLSADIATVPDWDAASITINGTEYQAKAAPVNPGPGLSVIELQEVDA